MSNTTATRSENAPKGTLGTFSGVFTPSILTILGIILFLRLGFVVGGVGAISALVILGLATAVTLITSTSLSAIATNFTVRKGGPYYIISRTLGPEMGGAIGLILFCAQAVSVSFYAVGFGEGFSMVLGLDPSSAAQPIAFGAIAVLTVFAWLGSDWASKLQMVILVVLAGSIISFFVGVAPEWSGSQLRTGLFSSGGSMGFWTAFAIFFPAVTGFTQGVAMSGDLRNPGKSIPSGVFWSIGISTVVYVLCILAFAGAVPAEQLRSDPGIMRTLSPAAWLIDAGVMAATLSSAMASFLGAPRILQALAGDRIIRMLTPFAQGVGPSENPRRAVLLTLIIAALITLLGRIDLIAPIVSMFFLITYGLLNWATVYEARADSPSFRPRFKYFSWKLSLAGALACGVVMLLIDVRAGLISIGLMAALVVKLRRSETQARWADSKRSFVMQRIRRDLQSISRDTDHARDWRPHVLAFSDDPHRREKLLEFARWIEGGSGFTTAVRILFGSGAGVLRDRPQAERQLRQELRESGHDAYPLVVAGEDLLSVANVLFQSYGVGPIKANLILLNWLEQVSEERDLDREKRYGAYLRTALRLKKHVVVLEAEDAEWDLLTNTAPAKRQIDVWWFGDATSRLLLLLGYLMTRTDVFEEAFLRVCVCLKQPGDADSREQARAGVEELLAEARIEAEIRIVEEGTREAMISTSQSATIVLCPFRVQNHLPTDAFGESLEELVFRLPVTAAGIAGEDIELAAEPDEGSAARLAAARDQVEQLEKRAKEAELEVVTARRAVDELRAVAAVEPVESGESSESSESSEESPETIVEPWADAEKAAEAAARRAAKARIKAEHALRDFKILNGESPSKE